MAKVALGKGLGALISPGKSTGETAPQPGEKVVDVKREQIVPSPLQPRRTFQEEQLKELADSIREHGVVQPLILRAVSGRLELIAGERRWRAATLLNLATVPAIIREASDRDVLELALIENLQREDLNVIEEAEAYKRLSAEFDLRQDDIARKVGRSRAAVANSMRLLDLDPEVQGWLVQGRLTTGHGKALLSLKSGQDQRRLAEECLRRSWTVREIEKQVAAFLNRSPSPAKSSRSGKHSEPDPAVARLQNRLREHLATRVVLDHSEKKGRIEIEYYGLDDLQRLLELLGLDPDT